MSVQKTQLPCCVSNRVGVRIHTVEKNPTYDSKNTPTLCLPTYDLYADQSNSSETADQWETDPILFI